MLCNLKGIYVIVRFFLINCLVLAWTGNTGKQFCLPLIILTYPGQVSSYTYALFKSHSN